MIGRLRGALPALHNRDFALLFSGQAISVIGDALFPVALAFAVLELSGSPSSLGLVLAAQALPLAAFALVGGVIGDRVSRQRLMLASDLARAATQAVAATLLIAGVAEIWHLAVLAGLYGAAEAFFRPAAGGLIPRLVPDEQLLQANSLIAMSQSLGMVLGPALAGVLIALFGPGSAIAIDAASFVVSAGCLWLMTPRPGARVDTSGDTGAAFLEQLKEGWGEVTSRVWLRSFLGVLGAYHLIALPCVLALGPIVAERELNGASSWAVIVAMFGIGSIIGAAIGLRAGPRRPMVACAVAFLGAACQPAIIAGAGSTLAIGAFELLAGICVAFGFTVWETTLGREVPAASLSRVTSFDWFTSVGLMPLGYALVGPVADAVGLDRTMFAATAIVASLGVASLLLRDIRSFEGGHPNLRTPATTL
jgi:predicted MFS family arabinose efflux permease